MAFAFRKPTLLLSAAFLFVIGALSNSYAQQNPQAVFDQGNEQLENGNYRKALSIYHRLESQNTVSGALFLNMGVSYQRLDSLGKAKYYFMKASHFEETEEKATQAIESVNQQFSRQSAVLPKLPWDVATEWMQEHVGAQNLLLIAIILLNLGVIVFVVHWFLEFYPQYMRIGGLILCGAALLIMAAGFYTRYVSNRYHKAVMVTEKASVLEQPQQDASLVSQAFEGYTFTVDSYQSESRQGWSYVRMSNGLYGWIPSSDILIL